jgi:NAD+ kinase
MTALIVYKKSTYEFYVLENTDISLSIKDIATLKESHDANQVSIEAVKCALEQLNIDYKVTYRAESSENYDPDIIIAVGGDGTFIEATRAIKDNPIILGVNSDPRRSHGHYCKANRGNVLEALASIVNGTVGVTTMYRLKFSIDGVEYDFPAMNDLLVHHSSPAGLTNYEIRNDEDVTEEHFCSGIWISSPSGTSGAISSFNGPTLDYHVKSLAFQSYGLNKVKKDYYLLDRGISKKLTLISKMRDGKIYVDGKHVIIDFPYNSKLEVSSGREIVTATKF